MASLLLLKIYGADPRYLVDDQELNRLEIDPDYICDHGVDIQEKIKKETE